MNRQSRNNVRPGRQTRKMLLGFGFVIFFAVGHVLGQTAPPPRILYVSPNGGQVGTTLEVVVTGQDIKDAETLHFSFPGAKVEAAGSQQFQPPPDPKQKKPPVMVGQLSQKFKVTLPANVPLGIHDLRIVTKGGISNPRAFVISDIQEYVEKEPNNDVPQAQKVELNSSVSGVILAPTDVDYYLFSGKKGQRVVASCLSTSIDSKLMAALELYSLSGVFLGSSRSYSANDALLDAVLPEDGDYYVRVHDFTYTQGGPDNFYRLTLTTAPWIDAVIPAGVESGKETKVTVWGRNLPGGVPDPQSLVEGRILEKATVSVKAPADPVAQQQMGYRGFVPPAGAFLDGFEFKLNNQAGSSNPYLLTFARAPVVAEEGDNDSPEKAQKIAVPCEVGGRIEKKGDRDWYAFQGKKGQVLAIEAFGDRLGSALDLYFVLRNEKGDRIIEMDDNPEVPTNQFYTRSEDPGRYRFAVPADGTYYLMVSSKEAFTDFGPRFIYQVRIAPEEPDFRLVAIGPTPVAPDSLIVGQGGHQAYTIYVSRVGGFSGDITLTGVDLPAGVTMSPQIIPGNLKVAPFSIHATPKAPLWTGSIKIVGTAAIDGKKVVRDVRSATISWPIPVATIPTIARLDRELTLAVRDPAPFALVTKTDKITVAMGEQIFIPVSMIRQPDFKAPVNIAALGLPPGMIVQPVTLNPGSDSAKVNLTSKMTPGPGIFTVILRGQTAPINPKQAPKGPQPPNLVQASSPISVTIVPKQVAKFSVTPQAVKILAGKQAEIVVRVARQYDYSGPFKVELVLPANLKGLKVPEATIKAGEDEAKLNIEASGAAVGLNSTLAVRATAMFNETPIVHETKLTVSVVK